jgi:hypothetical protein
MDEPSKVFPGCLHRKLRHSPEDCEEIALKVLFEELEKTGNLRIAKSKAEQAYVVCQIHRETDRETENCGCRELYKELLERLES